MILNNPEETKEYAPRFKYVYFFVIGVFLLFMFRLWFLQILQGKELRDFSEKNRLKQIKIAAPRGRLIDRNGKILVNNRPVFEALLVPQYVSNFKEAATVLAPVLQFDPEKLYVKIERARKANNPFTPIRLKEDLSLEEIVALKKLRLDLPGLDLRESVVRSYPMNKNGAQLYGYIGEISKKQLPVYNQGELTPTYDQGDLVGKTGIEEVLEKQIRGRDGVRLVQVDAFGRESSSQISMIYGDQLKDRDPDQGGEAILTIDADLQTAAWDAFEKEKKIGGLVAMTTDGQVLAWVDEPSFDPNHFASGISTSEWAELAQDPNKPLRNRVIQDQYAPGSSFKPFVALAALQEKIITPETLIFCPGLLRFGNRDYHDTLKQGHGTITVYEAIEQSSNVFFYKMGIELGIDRMYKYISAMGIGSKTGIEIPREIAGRMPSAEWKKQALGEAWQPGENLTNAIGQGFVETTLMQMAVGYNMIATGGKVVRPYVIQKIKDPTGATMTETGPKVIRNLGEENPSGVVISQKNFEVVREAMRRVVQGAHGTARSMRIPGVEMAGKTGTAQVMGFSASEIYNKCENRPFRQRHHALFVAFAPADKPEIVVAAIAEHACHGGPGAGPLVRAVMKSYFEKYRPELMQPAAPADKQPVPVPVQTIPEGE